MSALRQPAAPEMQPPPVPHVLEHDRGSYGMWLAIATEAALFVMLFFSYILLSGGRLRFAGEEPPKLTKALLMLAILLLSSVTLEWAQHGARRARRAVARGGLVLTLFLGLVFMVIQVLEYREHLRKLTPASGAYGSIFYTVTSFHGLHLLVGALMLGYVLVTPERVVRGVRWSHRLHNTGLYWHFVDAVWVAIVILLYVLPNLL